MSETPVVEAPVGAGELTAGARPETAGVPVSTVLVLGFGLLVAVAVGLVLLVGVGGATHSTRTLLQERGEAVVDLVERDIRARLSPALDQSKWIARAIAAGEVDIDDHARLDEFMFGALAGTPHVAGIAIVTPDAQSRRWLRAERKVMQSDWSDNPDIVDWVNAAVSQTEPKWRSPFWTDTLNTAVVMLDTPLVRDGQFVGVLAQVVPINELAKALADIEAPFAITPFVLFERNHVLAHPKMVDWRSRQVAGELQLPRLAEVDPEVLPRIWTPDEEQIFILRDIDDVLVGGAVVNDEFHLFLYRDVSMFGQWTMGVHFNAERTGGDEYDRLLTSLWVGIGVLVLSVIAAAQAGKRLSGPVQGLAEAARAVRSGGLDAAPRLRGSRIRELDDASKAFNQMVGDLRERELIRRTLGRFVPERIAQTLLSEGGELDATQTEATVLFCDLEGFTALTEQVGADGIMTLLNEYFEDMVSILERHNGVVTQFQGDAILATFNVPVADPDHAANALRAAREMHAAATGRLYAGHAVKHRIGIATGPVVAGAVGATGRLSYTVHGDAVNLAARLEAYNKDLGTRILVSGDTAPLVDDGFELRAVGAIDVRGRSAPITVFELG